MIMKKAYICPVIKEAGYSFRSHLLVASEESFWADSKKRGSFNDDDDFYSNEPSSNGFYEGY